MASNLSKTLSAYTDSTTDIPTGGVTLAQLATTINNTLLGASTGIAIETIAIGSGLTLSAGTLSATGGGSGTVTSVAQSFTGGLISVSGSPVTTSGTLALTVAGTSGGGVYFSSTSTWASTALLAANAIMIGGGAGNPYATTTTGTGVLTALGVNVGSAGAFVTFNGALGTPSSGTLTNATGLPISTGVSGLGTGIATFLATPSSANLASAVTDETGSGALMFGTAPTITTSLTMADAANFIFNTTTGTKIGTGTSQKLAFYNSTPIVQPTGDVITALQNLGLVASATVSATTLTGIVPSANGGTGINNAGTITNASNTTITGGGTIALGGFTLTVPATGTATLGTGANSRIAFWNGTNTITSSSALTFSGQTFTNTNNTNVDTINTSTALNTGGATRAITQSSNGTSIVKLIQYGTSYTTAGLLVAGLSSIETTSTVGLLHNVGSGGTYWWNHNSTTTSTMSLTSSILLMDLSANGVQKMSVSNANGGGATQSQMQVSNGTSNAQLQMLGTGFTTSGLNVADLSKISSSSSVGMLFQLSTASTKYWWTIGGVATTDEYMNLTNTALTVTGNVKLSTAGNGIYIKEGTNATMGVATLVAGTVTVSTTKVTASSRIFLTVQSLGTVAVATPIAVTARTAATSFTITSSGITDTSVIAWMIVEPA